MSRVRVLCMREWWDPDSPRFLGNVGTIGHYPSRGAVTGGRVVMHWDDRYSEYIEYLASCGIDVDPIWVFDNNLYAGILDNLSAREQFCQAVQEHGGLFFMATDRSLRFTRELGLDLSLFNTGALDAVRTVDDKALDRLQRPAHPELPDVYAPCTIVNRPHTPELWSKRLRDACKEMHDRGHARLIVRPSNLASGELQMSSVTNEWLGTGLAVRYLRQVEERNPLFMLVEAFFPHVADFSVLYYVESGEGRIAPLTLTRQYKSGKSNEKHEGNGVSTSEDEIRPDKIGSGEWTSGIARFLADLQPHIERFRAQGGSGPIVVDGLMRVCRQMSFWPISPFFGQNF